MREATMNREQDLTMRERAAREAWSNHAQDEAQRVNVIQQDDVEDWPLLTFLLGGLALALIANTFFGLTG
jgi:hypothetical protein